MLIKVKSSSDVLPSEITSESAYINRRAFFAGAGAGLGLLAAGVSPFAHASVDARIASAMKTPYGKGEELTPFRDVARYNNFYEFGTDKSDPEKYAHVMKTDPWFVTVEGEADNTGTFQLEDLLKGVDFEERIYRLRCVEAWSMVIPWVGFPRFSLVVFSRCQ